MKISIDIDGVLADFTKSAIIQAKKVFDIDITKEDIKNPKIATVIWQKLSELRREEILRRYITPELTIDKYIYEYLCPRNFFIELEPFPGAIEGVKDLYREGHEIIFLTKPLNWNISTCEKEKWIKNYFKSIKYSLIMISKMEDKHLISSDVLIDDDPRALINTKKSICIKRPWNEEFRKKNYEGITVDEMRDAADLIIDHPEWIKEDKNYGGFDAPENSELKGYFRLAEAISL